MQEHGKLYKMVTGNIGTVLYLCQQVWRFTEQKWETSLHHPSRISMKINDLPNQLNQAMISIKWFFRENVKFSLVILSFCVM